MIRPITVICLFLALGAGLYLYRAKHEVEMMDKHIEQIAKETNDLRAESRRLLDDWIRLGEPEQLHKYSDQYLGLKSIAPTQFVRLTDLQTRLPVPRVDPPEEPAQTMVQSPDASTQVPASTAGQVTAGAGDTDVADADELPVPPIPPLNPPIAAAAIVSTAAASPVSAAVASPAATPGVTPGSTSVSLVGVTAPPLQARPVTPRPAAGQQEPAASRLRAGTENRTADEPRAVPKPVPVTAAEPRQPGPAPAPANAPGPPIGQAEDTSHALPPLQTRGRVSPGQGQGFASQGSPAQGMPPQGMAPQGIHPHGMPPQGSPSQGMPPLQAQAPTAGQSLGSSAPRPPDARTADTRSNDQRRDTRPASFQADARAQMGPGQTGQPGQGQPGQGQPAPGQMVHSAQMVQRPASGPAGSLLGSRGVVPLPLPAPMPVSSTWPGPPGSGR